jgi:hypothetical protein
LRYPICCRYAAHEQDAVSDLSIVFAIAVEPCNFPPFPQILLEEIEHLEILTGAADEHKQKQLPSAIEAFSGYVAARRRA